MDAKSYSAVRKDLAKVMDKVCNDHSPLIITRQNANSVVMISLEDYNAIEETAYLLRSPANAKALTESLRQAEAGELVDMQLFEEDEKKTCR